jgi:hypothetical protein
VKINYDFVPLVLLNTGAKRIIHETGLVYNGGVKVEREFNYLSERYKFEVEKH